MSDEPVENPPEESEIQALAREMRAGFKRLEDRMAERADVNQRFEAVNQRFEAVDQRFDRLEKQIEEEGKTTRRHFDVVAESMRDVVKVIAESQAHHATVLDDHEARLKSLENR